MQTTSIYRRREVWSWALYDWANSAFAATVLAGFFPVFFKQYWSAGTEATVSTFQLGIGSSAASLVVMFLSPVLGSIADRAGLHRRFLLVFTALGVLSTAGLYFVGKGDWQMAMWLFVGGSIGFFGGLTFYDSLIVTVAKPSEMDRVSALGYSLGYLGGGVLLAVNVAMTLKPALFGIPDASAAVRISFLMVAMWWLLFSLPLFRNVAEVDGRREVDWLAAGRAGVSELAQTLRHIRGQREILLFLIAYWLYIDGVHTIIRMAVDYGLSLGFSSSSLILALLLTQFVGFPAAIAFGYLGDALGTRRAIYIALLVYGALTIFGYFMQSTAHFYALAITVGLVQGGIQSLSRSYFARLIPEGKSGEYFGFYNMMGKFAAIIGPLLVGVTAYVTGDARLSILSILVLFIAGGLVLARVPDPDTTH